MWSPEILCSHFAEGDVGQLFSTNDVLRFTEERPSLHVLCHTSCMRLACRMMRVRSVFDALIFRDHSAKPAGAISSMDGDAIVGHGVSLRGIL